MSGHCWFASYGLQQNVLSNSLRSLTELDLSGVGGFQQMGDPIKS